MKNGPYELVVAPADYPGKKYRDKYVYEHQLVWWRNTGKLVPEGFLVHHKDENKRNNDFHNLELKTVGQHTKEHHKPVEYASVVCPYCAKNFIVKKKKLTSNIKLNKQTFCSRQCIGYYGFPVKAVN